MADNTTLPGTGETVRTIDRAGVETQVVALDIGGTGGEVLAPGDGTTGLDVDVTRLPDATTAAGTLDALDEAVTVSLRGHAGASVQLVPTSAALSLAAEVSHDGSTWVQTYFFEPAVGASWSVSNPSFATAHWLAVPGGATHVRVRVDGYTSGSVAAVLSAADAPTLPFPAVQYQGAVHELGMAVVVGGVDLSARVRRVVVRPDAPGAGDYGLVVRQVGAVDVDVLSLPSLPSGSNLIGGVTDGGLTLSVDDNGTTISVDDGAGSLTVDGSVSLAAAIPAGTNNIGDVDVLSLPAGTVAGASSLPAGTNNIGDVDVLTLPGVAGAAAHDAAVSGNPVLIAGRANSSDPAVVADGDVSHLWLDLKGRVVVMQNFPTTVASDTAGAGAHGPKVVTLTTTGDAALVAAPGAGLSTNVTGVLVTNTSATAVRVDIKDGTTTRTSGFAAASGGGFVFQFSPPWKVTGNAALNGALSAAVTDVRVTVHYYTSP